MTLSEWKRWLGDDAPIFAKREYGRLAARGFRDADIKAVMDAQAKGDKYYRAALKKAEENKADAKRRAAEAKAKLKGENKKS